MKNLLRWLVLAMVFSQFGWAPPARADEADELAARGVILRTRDVKDGMRGVAKTVFKGTQIDSFDVEILSVMEGAYAGGEMILFRVLNGPVVERKSGIIAGMSGSPVYVDGKLIGAIAYSFSGGLEPIGGISPIEEMLNSLEPKEAPSAPPGKAARLRPPVRLADRTCTQAVVRGFADESPRVVPANTLELRPVATPLFVSGFRSDRLPVLGKLLKPYGLEPMQGIGKRLSGIKAPVEPGCGVGVELVSGDLSMGSYGTLTYRDGNRVLAFGHPFLNGRGVGSAPLTTAYVHEILPHRDRSYKLMSGLEPVGAVTRDWLAAVGGVLGREVPMIPVTVTTRDPERGVERTFHFSVVNHKDLTSELMFNATLEVCYAGLGSQNDGTVELELRAEGKGIQPLVRRNRVYTRGSLLAPPVLALDEVVQNLMDNPFERVELTRLELVAEVQRKRSAAEIERVTVSPSKVKPGDDIHVSVALAPKEGKPETRQFTFTVPKDTPGGNLLVGVASDALDLYLRSRLGLYLPRVTNVSELLWMLDREGSNAALRVEVALPSRGAAVEGQHLTALPDSVLQIMQTTRSTGMMFPLQGLSKAAETPWDIAGRVHLVTVQVLGKRPQRTTSRPPSPPPSGGRPSSPRDDQAAYTSLFDSPVAPRPRLWALLDELSLWDHASAGDPVQDQPDEPEAGGPKPEQPASPPPAASRPSGPAQPTKPAGKPSAKPKREGVARPLETWRATGVAGFLQGKHHNSCVTSAGDLCIAPSHRELVSVDDLYVWSLAAALAGGAYAGVGNSGRVYRFDPEGHAHLFAETASAGLYAMTVTESGTLLAGLSPGGKLVEFDSAGTQQVLCDLDEEYIWGLFWESKDALLIATGTEGRIYRLKLGGKPEVAYDLPQRHVRRLVRASDGVLYASTGDLDVLCKLGENGTFSTVYQSGDGEILGLAPGDDGALYFSVANKGNVYKWSPSGQVDTFFESAQTGTFDLVRDREGSLYLATTGPTGTGIVYAVDHEGAGRRILEPEAAQALCLALTPRDKLLVGLANDAAVHELSLAGTVEATYESEVHDAERAARWGTLNWTAQTPEGCSVELELRSGNTEEPDDTWSDWQRPVASGAVWSVPSPASQFLQFRVHLRSSSGKSSPRVQAVEVVYLPGNQPPKADFKQPAAGARWSGTQQVTWTGADPDDDPLRYELFTSADGGGTWKPLKLKDAKNASHELDTKTLKDGTYRVKVVATDELANPGAGLAAEAVSDPFVVDNTAPFVVLSKQTQAGDDGKVVFHANAVDDLSRVTGAEFRVDGGDWQATKATDGIFDSGAEELEFEIGAPSGKRPVELRVRDEAGNLTTKKLDHEFPAKANTAAAGDH